MANALHSALEAGDALACRGLWSRFKPHLPQPSEADAEAVMHIARTASNGVSLPKRLYSHAWLTERAMRSQLPEDLRPPSEKKGPNVIAAAVGVSVNTRKRSVELRAIAKEAEAAMAKVGGEMTLFGVTDQARISAEMWRAYDEVYNRHLRRVYGVA